MEKVKNYKKQAKYAELMEKLDKALKEEFFYEAIFIEFAVLEDRTASLLRHAGISTVDDNGKDLGLYNKIREIKRNSIFKNEYVEKHDLFSILDDVDSWRVKRNDLMHDLANEESSLDEIKKFAIQGDILVDKLSNKSSLINNHNDKLLACNV